MVLVCELVAFRHDRYSTFTALGVYNEYIFVHACEELVYLVDYGLLIDNFII